MADEKDRLANIRKLETQMAAQAKASADAAKARENAVAEAKKAQSEARAEQLRAQREATALATRLGATIDTKTGVISKENVTNPFGVFGPAGAKTKVDTGYRGTGKNRVFFVRYADGTEDITPVPQMELDGAGNGSRGGSDVAALLAAQAARDKLAADQAAAAKAAQDKAARQSAFDLLFQQFSQYGLGGLVEPLRGLIESGVSPSEFTIRLRETDAYKKRFAANQARIQKGLRVLSEAEYIGLEDQYQDVMRRYGLPDTYYTRGDMGRQEGFERFIGGDVSPVELEDRIQTAQRRVINAAPEITASLRSFYPEIGQGDLLAYFLDPDKAIENIKRKVTAAEIGGAATMAGLATGATRAEELARYGVTGEAARQGFQTVASVLPRGSQLAEIYKQGPYTQTTAEQEVFGLAGAAEAGRQRRKLTELEQAAFSGQAGAAGGALARDRAGAF